ncbi:hypothetical protein V6N13_061166 [Hibiscus sabdariffa]
MPAEASSEPRLSDQPKTKVEQLAAARLDVYLSHHTPYSYKSRWKECSAHLSYGSLPQQSFARFNANLVFTEVLQEQNTEEQDDANPEQVLEQLDQV